MSRIAMMALLCACDTSPVASGCPSGVLVVTETPDYTASNIGVLPLDGTPPQLLSGNELGTDPALSTSQGRHFLIARDRDTIFEVDPCGRAIAQYSARAVGETGPTDPQDVAVAPDGSLWVARFDVPSALVIPTQGTGTTIDLSAFGPNGNPRMTSVRIIGNKAFFALERLTLQSDGSFDSIEPSQIVVLDTTSRTVLTTVTLAGQNPLGLMVEESGKFWLADSGNIADPPQPTQGVEVFDTQASTSKLLLSGTTLGGAVVEVSSNGACGAAIVANDTAANNTSLVSFSVDGSNLAMTLPPAAGYDLRGLLWTTDGRLLLGDKTGYAVHTFTPNATCALMEGPDLPLPSMPALAFAN
jgi:DNA-binding beta-propeller fold protein YncE